MSSLGTPTTAARASDVQVAIIGMGCLFPRADGLKGYWRVLRAGIDCIDEIPASHWAAEKYFDSDPKRADHTYCRRGAFLDPVSFDPTEFQMPPSALEATDTSQILGLVVAKAALEDAGYGEGRVFDRERTSVILGVTGCLELVIPLGARLGHPIWREALQACGVEPQVAEAVVARISDAYVPWQENSFPGLLGNVVAGRIANRLNLHGTNCVVDAACASSNSAAHLAMLELASGHADMVVTGGVDTFNDIFMYMCFSKTPALSPSGDVRPFSAHSDGTLLGEGIGMVVLKRLADAERDGDRIYAVIRGVGTSSDGEGQAIYAPSAEGQQRCLESAYRMAGIDPATVGLVEAHGTGTRVGDVVEFEALRAVYSARRGDTAWCALGTVKSQIGHTKAAAGAAGLIKTALALHHKVLPPTLKADPPNPKLDLANSPFYLSGRARPWVAAPARPRRAALSAFGFGGSNFHIVLEEYTRRRLQPAWDGSVEMVALSADDRPALQAALCEVTESIARDGSRDAIARLAWQSRQNFSARHSHRLVMVVEDGKASDAIAQAARALEGARGDRAFYGEGGAAGPIAVMFPGQGSQYVEMGRDLACIFPEMLDALEAVDAAASEVSGGEHDGVSRRIFPPPSGSDDEYRAQVERLTRTDVTQPALGAIEAGALGVLRRFGLRPDYACGHSYGELVALHAAGRIDAEALYRLSYCRGREMGRLSGGRMISVTVPLQEADRLLERLPDTVTLANRNAPKQAIFSGSPQAIEAASAACAERGFAVQTLQVSTAFHSPLVAPARAPFRAALDGVAFAPGCVPVFANLTARPYPDDAAACRDLLADQLVGTVDFVGQIENLYAAGARVFIEVGPRAVLSGLVRSILDARPALVCALDASAGRGNALVDLARLLAQCAAAGIALDLTGWENQPAPQRKKKMEVKLVGANYRSPRNPDVEREGRFAAAPAMAAGAPSVAASRPQMAAPTASSHRSVSAPPASRPASPSTVPMPNPSRAATPRGHASTPAFALEEAFRSVQGNIAALQALQQQTTAAHQRFLEGQELAQRTLQQVLDGQQRLVERMLDMGGTHDAVPPAMPQSIAAPVQPTVERVDTTLPSGIEGGVRMSTAEPWVGTATLSPETYVSPAVVLTEPSAYVASLAGLESILLQLVADKTGYPVEMLHLDMDLETDLGIDSIKRVEILAGMEERAPEAARIETDKMGSLRTLRQVIEFLTPTSPSPHGGNGVRHAIPPDMRPPFSDSRSVTPRNGTPSYRPHRNGHEAHAAEEALLEIVAAKTGYPREMLGLDMDLETDLGIDSIKRVEILAAMEERVPHAARVETDRMGSLRTLRQVLEALVPTPALAAVRPPLNGTSSSHGGNGSVLSPTNGTVQDVTAPFGRTEQAMATLSRQLLTVREAVAAPPTTVPLADGHEIRVTDDGGVLSRTVVAELHERGLIARLVTLAEAGSGELPCGGFILVSPVCDAGGDEISGSSIDFLRRSFDAVASVAGALRVAAGRGGALLATVTRLDGAFGLTDAIGTVDAVLGGLSGLPKTAAHEWNGVRCRALDVAAHWTDARAAARAIVDEFALEGGPLEVGLREGRRFVPVTEAGDAAVADDGAPLPVSPGDVVVLSGGARGVTAEVAVAFAREWRPTVVLLGRSAAPVAEPPWLESAHTESDLKKAIMQNHFDGHGARPTPGELERAYREYAANREISNTLRRLREAGVTAVYRAVDVRDARAVRSVLAEVRQSLGPVRGLVHAAGVLADRRIEDKTPQQFDAVLSTKLEGLRHLLDACAGDELRLLVLFSSVTARFGRPGQVDYCMANEALNKIAQQQSRRRPACKVVAMNWGPWDGGMVTDGLRREFARIGVGLIPLEAGARALVRETLAPKKDVEVLIGAGFPAPHDSMDGAVAATEAVPAAGGDSSIRFGASGEEDMRAVLELPLTLEHFPFLNGHRIGGRAVVPMAVLLEWMGHAALHDNVGMRFVGVDRLVVLKGVSVSDGATATLHLLTRSARAREDRLLEVDVEARSEHGTHVTACVLLAAETIVAPTIALPAMLGATPYSLDPTTAYLTRLFHGPTFHAVKSIQGTSSHGIVAQLAAAPRPAEWIADPPRSEWLGDPLVLDGALQMGLLWCFEYMDVPSLPTRGGRYRQYTARFPKDGAIAWLEVRQQTTRSFTADITIADSNGQVLARCEDFEWAADASLQQAFKRKHVTEDACRP